MEYIKSLIKNKQHFKSSVIVWLVLSLFFLFSIWANSQRFEGLMFPLSIVRGLRYAFLYWLVMPAAIKFWESGKLLD